MATKSVTSSYQAALMFNQHRYIPGYPSPPDTNVLTYMSVIGKRDDVLASSNGLWPAMKGIYNCTNPYYRFVANFDVNDGLGTYEGVLTNALPSYLDTIKGDFLVPFSDYLSGGPAANVLTESIIKAKVGILSKYQAEVMAFQGGVAFGELRETLSMLRRPAKALRASITPYRKRQRRWINGRETQDVKNAIADTYLEWTFGVMPLIHDIKGAMTALARLNQQPIVKTLKFDVKYESFSKIASDANCYRAVNTSNSVRVNIFGKTEGGVRMRGGFRVDVAGHPGRNFGLDLDSFVPTLWELLPYSFLADYFSNIGDVLTAGAAASARPCWISQSNKLETQFLATVSSHSAGLQINPRQFVGPKTVYVARFIPSLAISTDDLRVEMPSFDDNAKQWLNIAALLESRRADLSFYNSTRR